MKREFEIAEINPTDGFTPIQMQKLNWNFRRIGAGFYQIAKQAASPDINDYESLKNKPMIEGVTLIGDKTYEQLNLLRLTNAQIEDITSG